MRTELCCVFANFGSADQQLDRPVEPATPPRNDQIVDAALGRCHLRRRNTGIPGHFFSNQPRMMHVGRAKSGLKANLSIWLRACTGVLLFLSASCSRLPTVSAVDFPPIPPGSSRIWFYRVYDPTESKGRP